MLFGIINNLLAQRADCPHLKLPQGIMGDESEWVYFWRDAVHRMAGRTLALAGTVTPDAEAIIRYHLHESVDGLLYFFAFTADHAYLWDNSNTEWDLMFTCASSCTHWSVADFDNYVVATNNLDKVQYWNDTTPATAFANLGGANGIDYDGAHYLTKAKYVIRHWNYLHLLSTYEDGTEYPENDRWCSAGDITDWDTSGAGDTNYRQLAAGDRIRGAAIYDVNGANQLLLFTQHSVNAAWLITADEVYESQDILNHGTVGPDSIVSTPDGNVYYISLDRTRQRDVRQIGVAEPLSYDIRTKLANMHPSLDQYIRGGYVGALRQIWWSVPETGAASANDTTFVLSLDTKLWQPDLPIGISAFGTYTAQETLYIDDISDIIDTVLETIDSFAPVTGDALFFVADYSGYTYIAANGTQDAGVDYTGSLVLSTDFTQGGGWNQYKRLHGAWLFFESRPGTSDEVTLSFRKGDEASWENLGTVSLDGDGKSHRQFLRFDKRVRDGHFKLAATNGFAFLGIIFDLDYTGARL
jgi:hypothetical protein